MWRVSFLMAGLCCFSVHAQQQLTDPTAPPEYNKSAVQVIENTQLRVQAISALTDGMVATINGKRYRIGDQLSPYQIDEITMDYVTVKNINNGTKLQLGVFNQGSFRQEMQKRAGGQNE